MSPHTNFPEEYRNGGLLALIYFLSNLVINYLIEDETVETILSALVAIIITVLIPFVKIAYEGLLEKYSAKHRINNSLEKTNKLLSAENESMQEEEFLDLNNQQKQLKAFLIKLLKEQKEDLSEFKEND